MKKYINQLVFIVLFCASFGLYSCEDVIDVNLAKGEPQLVVDAWITNQPGSQSIKLSITQPYFENSSPVPVLGATVSIEDNNGTVFNFIDADNDGTYIWEPASPDGVMGVLGNNYELSISYNNENYKASTKINRVMPIDSITYEFREVELGNPKGYYAQVYARDLVGKGDCYWIRTYKNGEFLKRGSDINIAYDAGFSSGGNIDGLIFITPIRERINPFYPDPKDKNKTLPPYAIDDSIYVEIYSITEDAFNFFLEVQTTLNNGGLFATPLTNVRTNIKNTNPASSKKAVGYFGASAVSSAGVRVKEEE